jgi:hypothetical protein
MTTSAWPGSSTITPFPPHVELTPITRGVCGRCSCSPLCVCACACVCACGCVVESEVLELMKKKDWAKTSLGAPKTWPAPLKIGTRVQIIAMIHN